jgi:hypothetical protein
MKTNHLLANALLAASLLIGAHAHAQRIGIVGGHIGGVERHGKPRRDGEQHEPHELCRRCKLTRHDGDRQQGIRCPACYGCFVADGQPRRIAIGRKCRSECLIDSVM